ncbi:preprotein translocase subunit SecA [Parafrankia colletiae]|uniref:Preprotein translocase subunit SecA n=1 Tax=Parafrankia colletiae TaxID=573497 RepID=A0A1S1Q897_9ACTN|nr:preprotein translocase subunit SecA [Parafrankia colletiae]
MDEPDLVALREFVPSATAPLTLSATHLADNPDHADRRIILGTLLPQAAAAVVRDDGEILLAMQTLVSGLDPAADLAGALLAALDAKPGSVVDGPPASAPAAVERLSGGLAALPRLPDLLDPAPLEITVHPGFAWWVPSSDGVEPSAEVTASLDRANATVVPTARLGSVPAAYWCSPGDRVHLRWALPLGSAGPDVSDVSEEAVLDALARVSAADKLTVGDGSRFVGSFRADGLVVPVWDLEPDADADSCEKPAAQLWSVLREALADPRALTSQERRVRAGVVGRTLTLR